MPAQARIRPGTRLQPARPITSCRRSRRHLEGVGMQCKPFLPGGRMNKGESMSNQEATHRGRRHALKKTAILAAAPLAFPAILRAQTEPLRLGHLTPRTGFLGQVGEYGFRGASLAVEEANTGGGVLGRQIELIAEDSVNAATAVTKAQKLIERDRVVCLIGEVSSASALGIAQQALRYKIPYFNTGANSDALRGS